VTKRIDFEVVKKSFESECYVLLTDYYLNNKQKLKYICPKGHTHSISWADWHSRGIRCPFCMGRPIITIDIVRKDMFREGYTLLTNTYINNKKPLKYMCPNGHVCTTNWAKWHSHGYRCPICYGNVKKTIEAVRDVVEDEGYTVLTKRYINCYDKLHLICPNNHNYYVSWDNWNSNGSRCPICNKNGISKEELLLHNFIKSEYSSEIKTNDYSIISPKELDIVIPDKKIAIEYCGLYWHSELAGKDRNYHLNKLNLCNEAGYRLITIFSDELNYSSDIVYSRLRNILYINSINKVYARKCSIKSITPSIAKKFCVENHLQGYGAGSTVKLGAFYNNDLVSVMTFAKPSFAKGHRNKTHGTWELHRFCSKLNTRIVGISSKLLKYFERNYEWNEIFSYADRRWSDGNLYEKLGFSFDKITKQNYWYIKGQCSRRINRFALRKKVDDPKDKTEWELRRLDGWNRIWDCGNLKYVKYDN